MRLLRRLGAGVRPDGRSGGAAHSEGVAFGAMLSAVSRGSFRSGRRVSLAPGVGVELDEALRARLAVAADAAEAAGARRLLVIERGVSLEIDVERRMVERGGEEIAGRLLRDVEAVAVLPEDPSADLDGLFSADAEGGLRGGVRWIAALAGARPAAGERPPEAA